MTELQNQSVTMEDEGAAVRAERLKLWSQQNARAIADYNAMIQKTGVPLAEFRKF